MTIPSIQQKRARSPRALRAQADALRSQFPRPVPELLKLEWQRYADGLDAARRLESEAVERELEAAAARRSRKAVRR